MNTTLIPPSTQFCAVSIPIHACAIYSIQDAIDIIYPHASEDGKSRNVLGLLKQHLSSHVFFEKSLEERFNFILEPNSDESCKIQASTCQFLSVFAHLCMNSELAEEFFAPGKPELILDSNVLFDDKHLILGLDPESRKMKLMIRLVESGRHIPQELYQKVFIVR